MHQSNEPRDRFTAYGIHLIEIHDRLRDELARLRADLDDYLDGDRPDAPRRPPRELRAYCLGFCAALTEHHTGEDGGAFVLLAERAPELRPVLAELTADHALVAGLLTRVSGLVDTLPAEPDPATARRVRTELASLAALLESHFTYEERKLTTALNALPRGEREGARLSPFGRTEPAQAVTDSRRKCPDARHRRD